VHRQPLSETRPTRPRVPAGQQLVKHVALDQAQQRHRGQNVGGQLAARCREEYQDPRRSERQGPELTRPKRAEFVPAARQKIERGAGQQRTGEHPDEQHGQVEPDRRSVAELRHEAQHVVPPEKIAGKPLLPQCDQHEPRRRHGQDRKGKHEPVSQPDTSLRAIEPQQAGQRRDGHDQRHRPLGQHAQAAG